MHWKRTMPAGCRALGMRLGSQQMTCFCCGTWLRLPGGRASSGSGSRCQGRPTCGVASKADATGDPEGKLLAPVSGPAAVDRCIGNAPGPIAALTCTGPRAEALARKASLAMKSTDAGTHAAACASSAADIVASAFASMAVPAATGRVAEASSASTR